MYQGTWKGMLLSKSLDADNRKGLPVTLYIADNNGDGDISGEITIQYRYQTDIYKAKYNVIGKIDYINFTMYIEQTELIFYDILPKGYKWCFGSGNFKILRNPNRKRNYIDGFMNTNCGNEQMRMILIKK